MCPKLALDIQAWKELPELVPGVLVEVFYGGGADPYQVFVQIHSKMFPKQILVFFSIAQIANLDLLVGCLEKVPKILTSKMVVLVVQNGDGSHGICRACPRWRPVPFKCRIVFTRESISSSRSTMSISLLFIKSLPENVRETLLAKDFKFDFM